jgi:uncharacterized protein (DUF1684 family)
MNIFEADWNDWHEDRERYYGDPLGWVSITGLHWRSEKFEPVEVIRRTGSVALRVHDPKAPYLLSYKGIPTYPPNEASRVVGAFTEHHHTRRSRREEPTLTSRDYSESSWICSIRVTPSTLASTRAASRILAPDSVIMTPT